MPYETCSLCGQKIITHPGTIWSSESHGEVALSDTELPTALINTARGELLICETCFKGSGLDDLSNDERHEAYLQFGLEYRDHALLEASEKSLLKALALNRTAEALAALAFVKGLQGDSAAEIQLYREVLQIDPGNAAARENLKTCGAELREDKPTESA